MAEQFVFEQRVREHPAIDRRERVAAHRPEIMQRACDQLLPGAGFALNKDGGSISGDGGNPRTASANRGDRPTKEAQANLPVRELTMSFIIGRAFG